MDRRQRARRHDQPAILGSRKGRDRSLDLARVAQVDWSYIYAGRCGHRLNYRKLADPGGIAGSHSTITRVRLGAISLSNSSHFPLKPYSNCMKPVALPPGCDRLSTKPEPTGSGTIVNTTGTECVA